MIETKNNRQTLVFDFDGVIHRYSKGWQSGKIYDPPTDGIKNLLDILKPLYKIVIISTRCIDPSMKKEMISWLKKYNIPYDEISAEKVPALAYIDDRAINFDGDCDKLFRRIMEFKPWTAKFEENGK